jgi:hypothetical protein
MNEVALYLCTTNDANGNPRRLFVIIDSATGHTIDVMDEGYAGSSDVRAKYPNIHITRAFEITVNEYDWTKRTADWLACNP